MCKTMKNLLLSLFLFGFLVLPLLAQDSESSQPSQPSQPAIETGDDSTEAQAADNQKEEEPMDEATALSLQQEMQHRQEQAIYLNEVLDSGRKLLRAGDLAKARSKFDILVKETTPEGPLALMHAHGRKGLGIIAAANAYRAEKEDRWDDAATLWSQALSYEPDSKEYKQGLSRAEANNKTLADEYPGNTAVTEEFVEEVKEVQRLMFEGDQLYETGQYDRAKTRYRQVLTIDPYNRAAIKKIRRVENAMNVSARERWRARREKALAEVALQWVEYPKKKPGKKKTVSVDSSSASDVPNVALKLQNIRIPELDFTDVDIVEAVKYLGQLSRQLDPDKKGVNFVLKLGEEKGSDSEGSEDGAAHSPIERNVSFSLRDVPLSDVLDIISKTTGLKIKVEEFAVLILPEWEISDTLLVRSFTVPPNFFDVGLVQSNDGGGSPTFTSSKLDVKQQLIDKGVEFAAGASASFLKNTSKLVIRGTPDMLNLIEQLVTLEKQVEVPQVEIESRFVEFTEDQLEELRFRWQVNANATVPNAALFPAVGALGFPPSPANALGTAGSGSFGGETIGLRGYDPSGVDGLTQPSGIANNSLDAAIGTGSQRAANTLDIGGIISGQGVRLLVNLINSVEGSNLLSSPKITLRQDGEGVIRVAREFVYPTLYDPPELEVQITDGFALITIVPANPSEFNWDEPAYIGVSMDVRVAGINMESRLIDLEFNQLQVKDFDGFINYGNDLNVYRSLGSGRAGYDADFSSDSNNTFPLVEGLALQPVFSTRNTSTSLQVRDGDGVIMGGFIREDTTEVNDKVPVLGDLPLIGRLFRSKVIQSIKRNLLMIVTANLINADGSVQNAPISDDDVLASEN